MREAGLRFNHVAMSVPAELLDEEGRKQILDFYGQVFGFDEMPGLAIDRQRLVLRAHSNEQFIFLEADPDPMRCAALDHFGMSVRSQEEFDALLERARRFRERHPEAEVSEPRREDFRVLVLHGFYVRYRLPMSIEVQHFEWKRGAEDRGPAS